MDFFFDLETWSTIPLKTHGSARYAEESEIMLMSWAVEDGPINLIDFTAGDSLPSEVHDAMHNLDALWWGQNSGMFDWRVIACAWPELDAAVPIERRRDTMVQAYSHSLPGNLEMMCGALGVDPDMAKLKTGRKLIHLFCKPQANGKRNDRHSHPEEWAEFCEYAKQDIVAMRECHRRMPTWNYKGKQLDLWFLDQRINARGMYMDQELADAAIKASNISKKELNARTAEMTEGDVGSATQVDAMLAHILSVYGVDLPDMQKATIERRAKDESLPEELRELLNIRLESSKTSVAKYTTLKNGVSSDGRLRGCMQFRGAARTGRVGHRLYQPGNMPRPTMKWKEVAWAIELLNLGAAHLVYDNVMKLCSNAIRGTIIAPPGKKLVVADLANIEGRVAAWLAGEEWELQAYRDYDAGVGPDLYVLAYAKSFNVEPETVGKGEKRQIGKVQSLFFTYGGGVGAWITGAATYRIDLAKMTEQVWDTLPTWARDEAENFLQWLYEDANNLYVKTLERLKDRVDSLLISPEDAHAAAGDALTMRDNRKLKARHLLDEKTFVACDAIKRLWRTAHPRIVSYWKELEDAVKEAITNKGVTLTARKLKIRCDGAWLRIQLPSGRALCYPKPLIDAVIVVPGQKPKHFPGVSYLGVDAYTKKWQRISTYGPKVYENICQAVACDILLESGLPIEKAGFDLVLSVHDEWVAEADADRDDLSAKLLGDLMCAENGWNEGLPLAAAGYEDTRYHKED